MSDAGTQLPWRRAALGGAPALAVVRRLLAVLLLAAGGAFPPGGGDLRAAVAAALLLALGEIGHDASRLLLPRCPPWSRAVAVFTLAVAFATTLATVLGHLGLLRRELFLGAVAIAAVLAPLARRWRTGRPPARSAALEPDEAEVAPSPGPGSRPSAMTAAARQPPGGWWWRAEGALLVGALLLLAAVWFHEAVATFDVQPGRGGDDLSYHLSAVAVWQRHGDLRMIKFSMGDWSTAFYPILPELSSWVLLAPFGHGDVLARWSALPYALASFVAVAALALRLGLSLRGAGLAVLTYATVRRVLPLAFTAGNDHATAFCTLAALDAALGAARRPTPGRLAYLGVALGTLVASKYIGLYNAAAVAVVFAVAWLAQRSRAERPLRGVLVACGAALLVGGYTYARNAVTAGNPVYPQPVSLLGLELPGSPEASLAARQRGEEARIDVVPFLTRRSDLLGSLFSWTLLPAALLAPVIAAGRRPRFHALVLALPVLFFLQFLYLMYDHRDVRYFLAGLALAGVALAWVLEALGPRWGQRARAIVLVAVVGRLMRAFEVASALEVGLALGAIAIGVAASTPGNAARLHVALSRLLPWAPLAAVVALTIGVNAGLPAYQRERARSNLAASVLEQLAGRGGATVAYAGYNAPYLYFGSRLQNDVRIVPRDRRLEAEYYTWGGTADLPYRPGTYQDWRWALDELGVRWVVIVTRPEAEPERRWMQKHERFVRVYADATNEIWRVDAQPAPGRRRPRRQQAEPVEGRRARPRPGRRGEGRGAAPAAALAAPR